MAPLSSVGSVHRELDVVVPVHQERFAGLDGVLALAISVLEEIEASWELNELGAGVWLGFCRIP